MPFKRRFPKKQRGGKRPAPFNRNSSGSTRKYSNQSQLKESEVGITEYINPNAGFSGIIKARFSDFHVNEIDTEGNVAKLTDLSMPKEFLQQETTSVEDESTPTPTTSPIEQIPQGIWASILELMSQDTISVVEMDVSDSSKEDRAKIHECIKKVYGSKIYATTTNSTGDSKRIMSFRKADGKQDGNKNDRDRTRWPLNLGEYVHFIVHKECLDTLETTLKIAGRLRMAPSNLLYAGVKDKRAKTSQWFSVRKVNPAKLLKTTANLYRIKLGNIKFRETPMKLGLLSGNRFRIALRNVNADETTMNVSLNYIRDKGFINYYGLQRFGNDKQVPTFAIGIQLLKGNWQEACDLILKPKDAEDPTSDVYMAKKMWQETRDAQKALKCFAEYTNRCTEYLLLNGLSKGHANDVVNALEKIPRNTRLLYTHSFQSLVWNHMASKRIQLHGLNVVAGDFVTLNDVDSTQDQEIEADELNETKYQQQVKILTEDDIDKYNIYDVILPLPGYDVEYPEMLKEYYADFLQRYGLSLEMPKSKLQTYNLSGNYRKLMAQVQDLQWKMMRYNDPFATLIRSDLEELKGEEEPQDIPDGKYQALILEFSLSSSSYATMVLRELLKIDTAAGAHAKLNDYYHTDDTNTDNTTEVGNKVGLLEDAAKYEQFKNIVFSDSKRKHDDEEIEDEEHSSKLPKL